MPKPTPKKAGRPVTLTSATRHSVTLTPTHIKTAKKLGNGNISAGIRTALEAVDDTRPPLLSTTGDTVVWLSIGADGKPQISDVPDDTKLEPSIGYVAKWTFPKIPAGATIESIEVRFHPPES